MADRLGLESLDREGQVVVLKFRQDAKIDPGLLLKLVESRGDLTLLPPAVLRLDLGRSPSVAEATRPAGRTGAAPARRTAVSPGNRP